MFNHDKKFKELVEEAVEAVSERAFGQVREVLGKVTEVRTLEDEIERLKRESTELEYKIGLERKRQEFEVEKAKQEATLAVREENLKADLKRSQEQMKFNNDRFSTEVGYLKDMVGEMLERLPMVDVAVTKRSK